MCILHFFKKIILGFFCCCQNRFLLPQGQNFLTTTKKSQESDPLFASDAPGPTPVTNVMSATPAERIFELFGIARNALVSCSRRLRINELGHSRYRNFVSIACSCGDNMFARALVVLAWCVDQNLRKSHQTAYAPPQKGAHQRDTAHIKEFFDSTLAIASVDHGRDEAAVFDAAAAAVMSLALEATDSTGVRLFFVLQVCERLFADNNT